MERELDMQGRPASSHEDFAAQTTIREVRNPRTRSRIMSGMMGRVVWGMAVLCVVTAGRFAGAQEFKVYTTISDVGADGTVQEILGRSQTYFRAGKVYDFMEEPDELVVYEPAHARFLMVNGRSLGTVLQLEQIQQFIKVAEAESRKRLESRSGEKANEALKGAFLFQLDPHFQQRFDSNSGKIELTSPYMSYTVNTARPNVPEMIEQYLDYCDAFARLNQVLHPSSVSPRPRLALNSQLRSRELLPSSVELKVRLDATVHRVARHQYTWKLNGTDRALIDKWEQTLESKQTKWVEFKEYQREVMVASEVRERR